MTSADVLAAILASRSNPANAAYFTSAPSNYLGGMKNPLTVTQLQQVASTGTVNYLAGGTLYHVTPSTGSVPFIFTPITNNPGSQPIPSNTPTPQNTTIPSNTSNPSQSRTISDTVNQGLSQIKTFFQGPQGPIALAIVAGLGLFLVVRK